MADGDRYGINGELIMKDMLVSVIIPVYNTEKYIEKCLKSVVDQTYKNLQIILVDDGATDSSPRLCDEWAAKDDRIEVIHKQNEGLGYTRNVGLEAAKGKYISFLDSDDTIELNTIEVCVDTLESKQADACFYPRKTFDKEGNYTICKNIPAKLEFDNEEVRNEFSKIYWGPHPLEGADPFLHSSVCRGMFLRKTIEDNALRFKSERIYLCEDVVFGLEFCKFAQKVIIIPQYFYNYTYNETSLTKSYRPQRLEQAKNLYRVMEQQLEEYMGVSDALCRCQHRYIGMVQQCVEMEVKTIKMRGLYQTYLNIKKICEDSFVRSVFAGFTISEATARRKKFVKLVLKKQVLILMIFYLFK